MAPRQLLQTLALASLALPAISTSIVVGGAAGWDLGVLYAPLTAAPGDSLVFEYVSGEHNVVQLTEPDCGALNSGRELAGLTASPYTFNVSSSGFLYFACSVGGHCAGGMLLTVDASGGNGPALAPISTASAPAVTRQGRSVPKGFTPQPLVPEYPGHCDDPGPSQDPLTPGYITRTCYSPGLTMAPGEIIDWFYALPNPYPTDREVAVVKQASQVVDESGREVPLSEIYVHHHFGYSAVINGEGAELRGMVSDPPLSDNFFLRRNGSALQALPPRISNFHFINTLGVQQDDLAPCIECWCRDEDDVKNGKAGGTACCTSLNCPVTFNDTYEPVNHTYYLQYNVTYRPLTGPVDRAYALEQYLMDVHNGSVEHDIHRQLPGDSVNVSLSGPIDARCPQTQPFGIVACNGHQHIGGQCITMLLEDGSVLCQSCPVYGTSDSVTDIGNEHGYLVKMTADGLSPPAFVDPGTRVQLVSTYDATTDHFGVMSLFVLVLANWDASCPGPAPSEQVFGPPGGPNAKGGNTFGIFEGHGIYPS